MNSFFRIFYDNALYLKIIFCFILLYNPLYELLYSILDYNGFYGNQYEDDGNYNRGRVLVRMRSFEFIIVSCACLMVFFHGVISKDVSGKDSLKLKDFLDKRGGCRANYSSHVVLSHTILMLGLWSVLFGGYSLTSFLLGYLSSAIKNYNLILISFILFVYILFKYKISGIARVYYFFMSILSLFIGLSLMAGFTRIYGPAWELLIGFGTGGPLIYLIRDITISFLFCLVIGRKLYFSVLSLPLGRLKWDVFLKDKDENIKFVIPFGTSIFLCSLMIALKLLVLDIYYML
mgnify:CR=1 FL=1